MQRLENLIENAEKNAFSIVDFFNQARAVAFERFTCPICKEAFLSRIECSDHLDQMHDGYREQRPLFCDVSLWPYTDRQHSSLSHFRFVLRASPTENQWSNTRATTSVFTICFNPRSWCFKSPNSCCRKLMMRIQRTCMRMKIRSVLSRTTLKQRLPSTLFFFKRLYEYESYYCLVCYEDSVLTTLSF